MSIQSIERVIGNYWIGYYVVFVLFVVIYSFRNDWTPSDWDNVELLSNIYGAAIGNALLVAAIMEVLGRMVLLIPKTVRAILEKGKAQGEELGRVAKRERIAEAYREAVNRGIMPDNPEIEKLLFDGKNGKDSGSR